MNRQEALNVLGLDTSASEEDIRKTYKKLALLYHPDRQRGKTDAIKAESEEKFKAISNAHSVLLNDPKTASASDEFTPDWFANFFKIPTKAEYIDCYRQLFEEVGLNLDNLQVFNTMTEDEVGDVGSNMRYLYEHGCFNQESFNIICEHLSWPEKSMYDVINPYASKFIFKTLAAKAELNISLDCPLKDYKWLVEAFTDLAGVDVDEGDLIDWQPLSRGLHLLTQDRLNKLVIHSHNARDIAYAIVRINNVELLNSKTENFIFQYSSLAGSSLLSTFSYSLLNKDQKTVSAILDKTQRNLNWILVREATVSDRKTSNFRQQEENKTNFLTQALINKKLGFPTKEFDDFKASYSKWHNKDVLFKVVRLYLETGMLSREQVGSLHYLLLHFMVGRASKNLLTALTEGLITLDGLNKIAKWSEENRTSNDDYLRYLTSDDCLHLMRNGLFSQEDVFSFSSSPFELSGYIALQIRNMTAKAESNPVPYLQESSLENYEELNKAVAKIQTFVRTAKSREIAQNTSPEKQSQTPSFQGVQVATSTSVADLELKLRQMAADGNLEQCKKLLENPVLSINSSGKGSGKTALHWAAQKGHVKIVRYLLDHGALLKKDNKGYTAYDLAELSPRISRMLQYQFKDYFMSNAPNPITLPTIDEAHDYGYNSADESQTGFMATTEKKSLVPFHEMLNKNKLGVNSYIDGLPIIMFPVIILGASHEYKNKGFLDYFIEHKCDLNLQAHRFQRDAYQGTILHSLLANENVDLAMHILNKAKEEEVSIDPTIQDVEGKTIVLMGALLRAHAFIETCFQNIGADGVNIADEQGMSPLHYACLFGDEKTIKILMQHGADPTLQDNNGKTALDMLTLDNNEAKAVFIEQLNKFHINAETRMHSNTESLLDKYISDRQNSDISWLDKCHNLNQKI